ncbi:hypothetical protein, partial [Persicobacter diffluens]|uniref:hypothetical protein n=1 Tax=Persicobacter diffluens TaxID=981 RepID=UPI0030C6D339
MPEYITKLLIGKWRDAFDVCPERMHIIADFLERIKKANIRSENLFIAEAIPDYFERIVSLLLRNYPKSLPIIRICGRMICF